MINTNIATRSSLRRSIIRFAHICWIEFRLEDIKVGTIRTAATSTRHILDSEDNIRESVSKLLLREKNIFPHRSELFCGVAESGAYPKGANAQIPVAPSSGHAEDNSYLLPHKLALLLERVVFAVGRQFGPPTRCDGDDGEPGKLLPDFVAFLGPRAKNHYQANFSK